MIINGGSRSNGAFFGRHLMRADENERVAVIEMRGLRAETIPAAFREMQDVASGTQAKNYFYHANLNTRADEVLSPDQWAQAVDHLERELGFADQPRFVVEHDKEGRVHRHVVWSRIDADSMTALSDSYNYRTHERVASDLEQVFGHAATVRALTRDKENTPRPEPNVKDWESFRAAGSRIDPKAMKAALTDLWQSADNGAAFAAALQEKGYILARGDRRDFCIIDPAGDEHSLARRIAGVKAADIRTRMEGIDREALPSLAEGRALARARAEALGDSNAPARHAQEAPERPAAERSPASTFEAVLAETARSATPVWEEWRAPIAAPVSTFDAVLRETVQLAAAEAIRQALDPESAGPVASFKAWWNQMRNYAAGWRDQLQEWTGRLLGWIDYDAPERRSPEHHRPERELER